MQLLLIEDEVGASDLLATRLTSAGFRTTRVQSCAEALYNVNNASANAVLIDQARNSIPPVSLVQPLRDGGILQPMLVLSPRGDWRDKVDALDAGADDYVIKPVHSEEVNARLRALIRRSAGSATDRIVFDGLGLDLKSRCAWLDGVCLNLSRNEFRMLRLLMFAGRQPVTREEIVSALSAEAGGLTDNAVEALVCRLRQKVPAGMIKTVRGVGYRLDGAGEPGPGAGSDRGNCRRDDVGCGCS